MLEFLQTGRMLYVLAAICALGTLSTLVTGSLYKRLIKETGNMALTKDKNLKALKQRMENVFLINHGIRNVNEMCIRDSFHTINECPAVLVGIVNRVKKSGVSHFLLFQNRGIPLFCKRIGIQDLISTAGRCGERNQDIRLPECKNFTDGICTCPLSLIHI